MIAIKVACPPGHESWPIDVFFGAWHPSEALEAGWAGWPPESHPVVVGGFNWFLASSTTQRSRALVHRLHAPDPALAAVGFRGYLLDPSLTTWSEPGAITSYWSAPEGRVHNGVFAAALVGHTEPKLVLVADALGIAPLYYRTIGDVVCFATNPRFLARSSDELDRLAAFALVHAGYVHGERSLSSEISRVGPGELIEWDRSDARRRQWFDYSKLPPGERTIRRSDLAENEAVFRQAVERCLRLGGEAVLPLSSGHDSRRILTALRTSNVDLRAITVDVRQKGERDLDAHWSSRMAGDLGFRHQVLATPTAERYAQQDRTRRQLLDSEAMQHAWIVPLLESLPTRTALVFDGLGGDVLGETGFEIPELHTCREADKPAMIAKLLVKRSLGALLTPGWWPSIEELRSDVASIVNRLPEGPNRADLAFLWLRTRRGVAPWSQYMMPAGHLAVYPFLDLDYLRTALEFSPLERIADSLQAQCLREFWPDYYRYPGSRNVPVDSRPGDPRPRRLRQAAALRAAWKDCSLSSTRRVLTARGLAMATLAPFVTSVADRTHWWLSPVLSAVSRHDSRRECWSLARVAANPRPPP